MSALNCLSIKYATHVSHLGKRSSTSTSKIIYKLNLIEYLNGYVLGRLIRGSLEDKKIIKIKYRVRNKRGSKVGFDLYFTAYSTRILSLGKHDWST